MNKNKQDKMFHSHSGWFFQRDGFEVIILRGDNFDNAKEVVRFDGNIWASIVASMSHRGENAETFQALKHSSDCGVHNEPAYPNTDCDCGLLLSSTERHSIVMDCYDADPIDCAEEAVETACIEQLKRIKNRLLALEP